jgi:hypothetical protein
MCACTSRCVCVCKYIHMPAIMLLHTHVCFIQNVFSIECVLYRRYHVTWHTHTHSRTTYKSDTHVHIHSHTHTRHTHAHTRRAHTQTLIHTIHTHTHTLANLHGAIRRRLPHTHTHTHTHTHHNTRTHTHTHKFTRSYTSKADTHNTQTHTHTHIHANTHTQYTHTHTHKHTHTYTHRIHTGYTQNTHTHTHTHTHLQTCTELYVESWGNRCPHPPPIGYVHPQTRTSACCWRPTRKTQKTAWSVCVCVCVCVCVHACMDIGLCIVCLYAHTGACVLYACMRIHVSKYVYTCQHVHVCAHTCQQAREQPLALRFLALNYP